MVTQSHLKVSVVIPTKNAGPILSNVLDMVTQQEGPWAYEVLVVDSGSLDKTVEIVKSFPSVRLIEIDPKDFGHGKTRNFAISHTAGEFIAMITQDALPRDIHWLKNFVSYIDQDELIAGVFGRHIAYPDASPFTRIELEQHFSGFLAEPIVSLNDPSRYAIDESYRQFLYFFSDNNALLRRSVWQKIPYPEIDFAEDQAWARLIIEAGYLKAYAHDAVVYHSHNYGFIERLQRGFDESYALKRIFSYQRGFGLSALIRGFFGITLRDLKLTLKLGLLKTDFFHVVRMPLDNLMRILGSYLGVNGEDIPEFIRVRLSRDKRLMSGVKRL
jgi:rhamnosyltransferase